MTTIGSVVLDVIATVDGNHPVLLVLELEDGGPEVRMVDLVRPGESIELEVTSIYHGKCELNTGMVCVFSRRDHETGA